MKIVILILFLSCFLYSDDKGQFDFEVEETCKILIDGNYKPKISNMRMMETLGVFSGYVRMLALEYELKKTPVYYSRIDVIIEGCKNAMEVKATKKESFSFNKSVMMDIRASFFVSATRLLLKKK